MANGGVINLGKIRADLEVDSGNLDRGIAGARRAIDAIVGEMNRLDDEVARGAIGWTEYTARIFALNAAINDLQPRMQAAYAAAGAGNNALGTLNATLAKGGNSRLGFALLQFSYIIDDLQYSVAACVNNIGPLIYAISGNMGVAAGAQVAAVAISQLVKHFDEWAEKLGLGRTRTEADELGKLITKTEEMTKAQLALNAAKKTYKLIEENRESTTDDEADRRAAIKKLVHNSPYDKLAKGVESYHYGQGATQEDIDRARDEIESEMGQAAAMAGGQSSVAIRAPADAVRERAEKNRRKWAQRQAEIDIANAEQGRDGGLGSMVAAARDNPKSFTPGLAGKLDRLRPGNYESADDKKARHDMIAAEAKDRKETQEIADKEKKKALDATAALDEDNLKAYERWKHKEDQRIAEETQADHEGAAIFKHNVGEAKKNSGIDGQEAKDALLENIAKGVADPMKTLYEDIKSGLKGQGVNDGIAEATAREMANEAGKSLDKDIFRKAMEGRPEAEVRHSEIIDSATMGEKIQASISNKDDKKIDIMKKIEENLAEQLRRQIEQKGVVKVAIKRGG